MAIMCELKCVESKKRKMVARLIASIYNAMHSLQTDDINPAALLPALTSSSCIDPSMV